MITHPKNAGFSLIEILVTIVILLVGLLGLAGLQGRALTSQMEAYQRSQALILLKDMADRLNTNRGNASTYITSLLSPQWLGTGDTQPASCAGLTGKDMDFCEWSNALKGAAETSSGGTNVGAMIGARGCITQTVAPASGAPSQYLVAVAWQGLNNTAAPTITCGSGQYGNEALRRVVALPVTIADLN